MTRIHSFILLILLSLGTLTGCAATLRSQSLPEGATVKNLAKVDRGAPLALNPNGAVATLVEGAVCIIDLSGGPALQIAAAGETPVTALCFSPSGERLAAAFATGRQSTLRSYDLKGKLLAEAVVPARVTSLAWRSEKELLATALFRKKFSFGTELASTLYRWDLTTQPVATALYNVTIRPQLAKLPEETLYQSLHMALSPYGDEIAYSALKDPPLFSPYLRIAVRHLDSGAERVVAEVGIGSGGLAYTPDGESLLVGNHGGLTRKLTLPEGKESNAWPAQGDRLALSPSGSYLLLDGGLYQGGREISSFPSEATSAFLPDGSGLVITNEGTLFLVSGPKDTQPPGLPKDLDRILELRKLRIQGLISDAEFKARLKKAPTP